MKYLFLIVILSLVTISTAFANFETDFKSNLYANYANIPKDFQITLRNTKGTIEGVFEVHKVVLNKSKYFRTYLERWQSTDKIKLPSTTLEGLELNGIDVKSFQRILYFLYHGDIHLDEEVNLAEVLYLQSYFRIEEVDQKVLNNIQTSQYLSCLSYPEIADLLIALHYSVFKVKDSNPESHPAVFLAAKRSVLNYMIAHQKWSGKDFRKVLRYLKSETDLYTELDRELNSDDPKNVLMIAEAKSREIERIRSEKLKKLQTKNETKEIKHQNEVNKYIEKKIQKIKKELKEALLQSVKADKKEIRFRIKHIGEVGWDPFPDSSQGTTANSIAKKMIDQLNPIYSSQFVISIESSLNYFGNQEDTKFGCDLVFRLY